MGVQKKSGAIREIEEEEDQPSRRASIEDEPKRGFKGTLSKGKMVGEKLEDFASSLAGGMLKLPSTIPVTKKVTKNE